MENATLWPELHDLANAIARKFKLNPNFILEPLSPKTKVKTSGICWKGDHSPIIGIRVHRYHRPKQSLKRGYILASLAHEMGHLVKGGWDHGPGHRKATVAIALWMREQGHPVAMNMLFHSPFPSRRPKRK